MKIDDMEQQLPPRVAEAIRCFLWSRNQQRPVSVAKIMRAARYAFPDLAAFSDDELAELIIQEMILEGCDIDFDRDKPNPVRGPVSEPARHGGGIERGT